MAPNITPGNLGRLRAEQLARKSAQRRREAEQAKAAGVAKPKDVARLTKLIEVLEEVSKTHWNHRREYFAQSLVAETRRRLRAIAAVSTSDDPIHRVAKKWHNFFGYNMHKGNRPRLSALLRDRIPAAMNLAKRAQSLLAEKCPERVDIGEKATDVRQTDFDRLRMLEGRLKAAAERAVPDSDDEKGIRDVALNIWGRLTEIGQAADEDLAFEKLLERWRALYRLDESQDMRVRVPNLQEEGALALALALVQDTIKNLGHRRPDGA